MITFNYKARDTSTNKIVRSTIQGNSEAAAARVLMAQGIVPLEMTPVGEGGLLSGLRSHVPSKEVVIFTRQLSTMLNAGLPLAQSLSTVADQTSNKTLKTIIADVVGSVNGGQPLSEALSKYPKVFNNVYIALVQAGETSGTLDQSLARLADQQEHDADQLSKIRGAMIYPAIVLVVIIAVVVFMMVSLIPQVTSMYDDLGKELPITTKILQSVIDFFSAFWWLIAIILGGLIFFARKLYMARFSRTAQVLLESGVTMIETLKISADAVNNVVVRDEILQGVGKVKNGKALSDALTGQDYILPFVPQMIRIGETSGAIDAMLQKVADYYDKEVDNAIAAISTLIEPILMVAMAGMIGFIVLAVLLPIYGLTDTSTL